jgi:cytoskeletal protein CcmA (bactofilin family)
MRRSLEDVREDGDVGGLLKSDVMVLRRSLLVAGSRKASSVIVAGRFQL